MVEFSAGTNLHITQLGDARIRLHRYTGNWKEGLADGIGTLKGEYIVGGNDNPIYQQMQSPDPAIRAQARAVIDRVRVNALFVGQDPDAAVSAIIGERSVPVTYRGAFRQGTATGDGEVSTAARKLRGTFYNWLPNGLVTHMVDEQPVLLETFANGLPSDGPVVIHQYRNLNLTPSRTFVGSVDQGKVSGDWFDLQWTTKAESYSTVALGDYVVFSGPDGSSTCHYDSTWLTEASSTDIGRIRGDAGDNLLQATDRTYLKAPSQCRFIGSNGWSFSFGVVENPPFNTKRGPPYSCADPQGRPGVMSIASDDMTCTITTYKTTYRWLSKIGKDLERFARNVNDFIFDTVNPVGKEFERTMCSIVQKEPGRGCTVSVTYGRTFDIPDSNEDQQQRARDNLAKFLAAREALGASNGPPGTAWESALTLYNICATSCTGPERAYSMLSVREIQKILSSGFESDISRYKLASWADAWLTVSRYIPFAELTAGTYSGANVIRRIDDANMYVNDLSPTEKYSSLDTLAVQKELLKIRDKYVVTTTFTLATESLTVMKDIAFSMIPGLPAEQQLALALGFEIGHPKEFFSTYANLKSADELVRKLIDEKFKKYGVPPPPTTR